VPLLIILRADFPHHLFPIQNMYSNITKNQKSELASLSPVPCLLQYDSATSDGKSAQQTGKERRWCRQEVSVSFTRLTVNLQTVKQLSHARCVDSHTLINAGVGDLRALNLQHLPSAQDRGARSAGKWPTVFVPRDSCGMEGKAEKLPKIPPLQTKGANSLQTFHLSFQMCTTNIYKPVSTSSIINNNKKELENEEIGNICAKY